MSDGSSRHPSPGEAHDDLFDELFVAGAAYHEPSAAERLSMQQTAAKEQRRAARQHRGALRRARIGQRRSLITIVVLAAVTLAWWQLVPAEQAASSGLPSKVKVMYALPAGAVADPDGPAALRHEIGIMQDWFEGQTGGRHLRMVELDGQVEVVTQQLTVTVEQLESRPDAAGLINDELLTDDGDRPDELTLVFAEAGAPGSCGEGSGGGYAIVWLGNCELRPSTNSERFGDGTTAVAAHELIHALGAVQPCAPHYGRNGHVTDDNTDLMFDGEWADASLISLDPGHDDYFRSGGDCPEVSRHPAWER